MPKVPSYNFDFTSARCWKRLISQNSTLCIGITLGLAVLLVDQLSKQWILNQQLEVNGPITINRYVDLILLWNRGISYGLFAQNSEVGGLFLSAAVFCALAMVVIWMVRATSATIVLSLGAIAGGAMGNLLDRLIYGAVVDFVYFHVGDWSWYVFNFADAAIVIAAIPLVLQSVFAKEESDPQSGS